MIDSDNLCFSQELHEGPASHLTENEIKLLEERLALLQSEVAQITKILGYKSVGMTFDPKTLEIRTISATTFSEYHVLNSFTGRFFIQYQQVKQLLATRQAYAKSTLNKTRENRTDDSPIGHYGSELKEFLFKVHYPQFGGCPPGENEPLIIRHDELLKENEANIDNVVEEFAKLHRRGVDIGWLARWCVSQFFKGRSSSELGQFAAQQRNDILSKFIPIAASTHLLNNVPPNRHCPIPKEILLLYYGVRNKRSGEQLWRSKSKSQTNSTSISIPDPQISSAASAAQIVSAVLAAPSMPKSPPKIKNNGNQCYIIALIHSFHSIRDIIFEESLNPTPSEKLLLELLNRDYPDNSQSSYDLETKYDDLFMYDGTQMDVCEIINLKMEFLNHLREFKYTLTRQFVNNGEVPTFSKLIYNGLTDNRGTFEHNIVLDDDINLIYTLFKDNWQQNPDATSSRIHKEHSVSITLQTFEEQQRLGNVSFDNYFEASIFNDGKQQCSFHEVGWEKDAENGEDVKTIYYVDMENKRQLLHNDPPKVLMVTFKLFTAAGDKLLIHPEFHMKIPLLFNWLHCEYMLSAIIIHHEPTMHAGHYTSYSFDQHRQLWLYADNDKLSWLKQGDIPAVCKPGTPNRNLKKNHFPYILFFRKHSS